MQKRSETIIRRAAPASHGDERLGGREPSVMRSQGDRVKMRIAFPPSPSGGGSDGKAVRGGFTGQDSAESPPPERLRRSTSPIEGEVETPHTAPRLAYPITLDA